MTTLKAMRDALKATIKASVPGVIIYDTVPDVSQLPAVVVEPLKADSGSFRSGLDTWLFDITIMVSRQETSVSQNLLDDLLDGEGDPTDTISDTFNRADSSSSPGTSSSGDTWTVTGGVAGIQNNRLYRVSGGPVAFFNTGDSDGQVSATLTAIDAESGLHFRGNGTDYDSWFFRINAAGTAYQLDKYPLSVVATGGTPVIGDKLRARFVGSTIQCYLNDVLLFSTTDTQYQSNTRHGVIALLTSTFDDFSLAPDAVSIPRALKGAPDLGTSDLDAYVEDMHGYGGSHPANALPHIGAVLRVKVTRT